LLASHARAQREPLLAPLLGREYAGHLVRFAALMIATGCAAPAVVTLSSPAVGHISGGVQDVHEDPIAGVVVVVTASGLVGEAITDNRGFYTIDGVTAGDHYAVTFYYNGGVTRRGDVRVRPGRTTPVYEQIDVWAGIPLATSPGHVPACWPLRRDGICFP
jgi:hypothetical protein